MFSCTAQEREPKKGKFETRRLKNNVKMQSFSGKNQPEASRGGIGLIKYILYAIKISVNVFLKHKQNSEYKRS